jgi:hypothetical protein
MRRLQGDVSVYGNLFEALALGRELSYGIHPATPSVPIPCEA